MGNSNCITCLNSFVKTITNFSIFPLPNYLFIIRDIITYNLGEVNQVTNWFSK